MAYPTPRSVTAELSQGAIDGKYKQVVNDRSCAEPSTQHSRVDLYDLYFGIHEAPVKVRPDGRTVHTPNFVPTAPAERPYC